MRYLIFFAIMFFTAAALGQEVNKTELDKILSEINPSDPGAIIGIVKDGKLIYHSNNGLANLDYNIPIDEHSNFRLSSTSKQFTAACIILLTEERQLNLTDPLSKFYPQLSEIVGSITIDQLLHHTSGIRDYMSLMMIQGSDKMDFFNSFTGTDEDVNSLVLNQESVSFSSGTRHSYSNTNYWLLGQIVEKISGRTLTEYAQENIFTPIGMNNSSYVLTSDAVISNRASGYVSACPTCDREEYRSQPSSGGDGGVVSSLSDLVRWEKEFHNPIVFSQSFWNKMMTTGKLNDGNVISYASGLIVEDYHGEVMVSHSGLNPGYSSDIIRFPKYNISIIAMGNQNWYDVHGYARKVCEILFPAAEVFSKKPSSTPSQIIELDDEKLSYFCGDYFYAETNEYRSIVLNNGALEYHRGNGPVSILIPISETMVYHQDRPHITMTLSSGEEETKKLVFTDGKIKMYAQSYEKVQRDDLDLKEYCAVYYNHELDLELKVDILEDKLILPLRGQGLPMEPTQKDFFSAMGMFSVKYVRNHKGEISGFLLDAPRAENILFKVKSEKT